jgi:5-methylcytosine-specific restriction protein B
MILDERVAQDLRKSYTSLQDEGKLLSNEQFENYYSTFRSRFGPDKLKNLDGEALLNLMYSGNTDSLVYWIEYKNDEEFPSPRFGSIAGGYAFKLGLFRKKETGLWTAGSSQKPVSLSIDEAIVMARRNRDQLLQGVGIIEKMPVNGTDEDYLHLQQEMNRVAPDISNLAWGHKYFHLLFPEKLDDFHNPDYQRFHLIKLLQLPPQGEGKYIAGGRFAAIAHELNIPMYHLTSLLNIRDGRTPYNYWRIGTGTRRDQWPTMRDGNFVAIGWAEIGDLTEITNDTAGKAQIVQLLLARDPNYTRSTAGRLAQQIFNFRWAIAENDLALASDGAAILGIGRVTGDYTFDPSTDYGHRGVNSCPNLLTNLDTGRFRRPESVRPISVPTRFRQVISPGVASQANKAGTLPLKPARAPPLCVYAPLHTGLACLHWGVPPAGFSRPGSARTGREPPRHPLGAAISGGFFFGCQCHSR